MERSPGNWRTTMGASAVPVSLLRNPPRSVPPVYLPPRNQIVTARGDRARLAQGRLQGPTAWCAIRRPAVSRSAMRERPALATVPVPGDGPGTLGDVLL